MAKIVVDVMLKPEILDPQGNAVASALPRLGFSFAKSVRQGKRFEIEVEGEPTAAQLAILPTPVIGVLGVIQDVRKRTTWWPRPRSGPHYGAIPRLFLPPIFNK